MEIFGRMCHVSTMRSKNELMFFLCAKMLGAHGAQLMVREGEYDDEANLILGFPRLRPNWTSIFGAQMFQVSRFDSQG